MTFNANNSNNTRNGNLMDILLLANDDADHETLSPAVPLDAAFGWQDFPLVAHSLQQQQENETDSSIIMTDVHEDALNARQQHVKIVPSPALPFDSFAWGDFPVVNKAPAPLLEDETTTVSTAVFSSDESLRSTASEEWDEQEQASVRRYLEATRPILFL